jgi:hypothetical protein
VSPVAVQTEAFPDRRVKQRSFLFLVLVVLAAVVTAGLIMFVTPARSSSLASVLDFAPAAAEQMRFIDWDAIDHDPMSASYYSVPGSGQYDLDRRRFGIVYPDASWELFYRGSDGGCDILQWPSADGPEKLAAVLDFAGWRQSTEAGRTILWRDTPDIDPYWAWAVSAPNFGIDSRSHRVAQCVLQSSISGALDGFGDDSFAAAPDVRALIATGGEGVVVMWRHGWTACQIGGLRVQGPTRSAFTTMELSLDNRAGTTGVVKLAYPTQGAATADLDARTAAYVEARARNQDLINRLYELRSIEASWRTIVARVGSHDRLDLVEANANLGLDDCSGYA